MGEINLLPHAPGEGSSVSFHGRTDSVPSHPTYAMIQRHRCKQMTVDTFITNSLV